MILRYPLNFIVFISIYSMTMNFLAIDIVWRIVISALVIGGLEYIFDRIGITEIRIPALIGIVIIILSLVLFYLLG